ncbi:hypothetical protein PENSTE_c016G09325 [Penicillium steckii]|uniref:Uncharacterized protein n=1 Tax=Penicillium steckii TaxID=303698 RepID=A0A1V6SZ42_9EURO|nr:hypothetical protein PENSTE_c016G09325 [Penicillium steckii]
MVRPIPAKDTSRKARIEAISESSDEKSDNRQSEFQAIERPTHTSNAPEWISDLEEERAYLQEDSLRYKKLFNDQTDITERLNEPISSVDLRIWAPWVMEFRHDPNAKSPWVFKGVFEDPWVFRNRPWVPINYP